MRLALLTAALLAATARAEVPPPAAPGPVEAPITAPAASLFGDKCAGCHGADGAGHTKYGKKHHLPDFTSAKWQKARSNEELAKAMREGIVKDDKKLMPSFKEKLSEADFGALAGYVRTLQR